MAKRLQVILKDSEYREFKRNARARHLTIAEWVRDALDLAHRCERVGGLGKKLAVIRAAARHDFPAPEIDIMLAEIESRFANGGSGSRLRRS